MIFITWRQHGQKVVLMDSKEFAKFAMALKTYYPRENLLPNSQAMGLWFEQLKDIEYKQAEIVLNKWVAQNKWAPSIADIRENVAVLNYGDAPDWSEGWEKVIKAIGIYGYPDAEGAFNSFDEITKACVKRIGWLNICMSENITADRANFREMFKAYTEREKKEKQLPNELRLEINNAKRLDG